MLKVYIASPYTVGDVGVNVRRQLEAVDILMDAGFAPFAPLYSHFQHIFKPRGYEDWMKVDLEWIGACDCLIRLDGESKGADREVAHAKMLGIPVYFGIEEFLNKNQIKNGTILLH